MWSGERAGGGPGRAGLPGLELLGGRGGLDGRLVGREWGDQERGGECAGHAGCLERMGRL